MSDRRYGYDDDYAYKRKERADQGGEYYAKEREHHRDSYHKDREYQQKRYDDSGPRFNSTTTESIRKDYPQYYRRPGDGPQFSKYVETQRTGLFDPPSRSEQGDPSRAAATRDNRYADRDRRDAGSSTRDFGYQSGHPLRDDYKTAKNTRERDLDRDLERELSRR